MSASKADWYRIYYYYSHILLKDCLWKDATEHIWIIYTYSVSYFRGSLEFAICTAVDNFVPEVGCYLAGSTSFKGAQQQ